MNDDETFKVFPTRPPPAFEQKVRAQIRKHHQPELISELRHSRIPHDETFVILGHIGIEQKKRPLGDRAPCPMCQPNKFLDGRLCWFPRLQCCAIIGHCCASHETNAAAEHEYRERGAIVWQQDYLLDAMPGVPRKLELLEAIRPVAVEAQRVHKKMRKHNGLLKLLRDSSKFGRLTLQVQASMQSTGTGGPQGFHVGSAPVQTIDFGRLHGATALLSKYDPVAELNRILEILRAWDRGADLDKVLDCISEMEPHELHFAYNHLVDVDHKMIPKFYKRLVDFVDFFDPSNVGRIDRWGNDRRNPNPVSAKIRELSAGEHLYELTGAMTTIKVVPGDELHEPLPNWPVIPKPDHG